VDHDRFPSRRSFLRAALAAPIAGMLGSYSPLSGQDHSDEAGFIVARVTLDHKLYNYDAVLNGQVSFRLPPAGNVIARWLDSFGRIVDEYYLSNSRSNVAPQRFSFKLDRGFTYRNWIRISINDVEQAEGGKFLLSPPPAAWDDFHVISWASYRDGFYDLLRQAGVDATIAYREGGEPAIDNNFSFYVEQMAWEVFAIYHKDQPLWRGLLNQIELDRNNMDLWIRRPCVNDPKTDEYVTEHLTRFVRLHRDFRPLFYNIADELGQGDQIRPNDFCHSTHCTSKFAEYLRKMYGTPGNVGREWSVTEETRWDDESLKNGSPWATSNLMVNRTTTDEAFDAVAVALLEAKYGGIAGLNKAWGTNFPAPSSDAAGREQWEPLRGLLSETRSVPELSEKALSERLGPIEKANARWGTHTTWAAEQRATEFKSWSDVLAFLKRFYHELSQVRSTERWNVSPWCDFRNFMDETFADAIDRARAVCKAEDPHARCATEGGQAPFAFGWYNYENVVKHVDVIEPYNIGNNVEVIRSLNPEVIMISTHGFQHKPGAPLTEADRLYQKRAPQPIWWGLFHDHRGSIIWDDNLPEYRFVDEETRQLTPAASTFADTFLELHKGIAKLIINGRRIHDGIAIHYSQPSMQIHWLLDNVQHARKWMLHSGGDRGSHFTGVRNGWTKLIEDLGLQYEFVGGRQIEDGRLMHNKYRALILPQSLAVSSREADQIRQFVETGGLLIADYRAATMNEHGRDLGRGQLDDLFGITHGKGQVSGAAVTGNANYASLRLQGRKLDLVVADDSLRATTGKALAQSGQVPLIVVNDFGQGKAVFLNVELASYPYHRLTPNSRTSLPEIMEQVFGLAGIEPQVRVLDENGKRLPGTEVVRFANGGYEHVAVFRNPQFDDGGWGDLPTQTEREWAGPIDNSLLEKHAQATVAWSAAMVTYDIRGGRALGTVDKIQMALDPWSPLVLTRAPKPIPVLGVEAPTEPQLGNPLAVTLRNESPLPDGAFRIVRLEFVKPDGKPHDLYARNVRVESSPHLERFHLAHNDPKGRWQINSHDLITGQVARTEFTLH
jgi:glycosyl hydrolase family 42 (putative beta-galactosidase)